jgi:hypothetical protein
MFDIIKVGCSHLIITVTVTNFMELSPSLEAASCAATQKLPNIFMEPEGSLPC